MTVVVSPRLTLCQPPAETHRRLGREDLRRLQFLSIFYGHEPAVVVSRLLAADMRRLARLPARPSGCGPP